MLRAAVLTLTFAYPAAALACSGKGEVASTTPKAEVQLAAAEVDATQCAKKAALVGDNCSYSTGMMAQRVDADGTATKVVAQLAKQDKMLDSHVAAPYKVDDLYVIANQVLEQVTDPTQKLAFEGKVLEVDGIKYFLVTSVQKAST